MDGVLVDYPKKGKPINFFDLKPLEGAIEAFNELNDKYEVYIASTAPWSNPDAWKDKRLWIERYLGESATKRLILTHRKDLLMGDLLIDDRLVNGSKDFKGDFILFESWEETLKILAANLDN